MFVHTHLSLVTLAATAGAVGVWVAGSLWASASATGESPQLSRVHVATAPRAVVVGQGASQRVEVAVPSVLYGPTDSLPVSVIRGATYTARVLALSTEPALTTDVTVSAQGARISGCVQQPLVAGTVRHLSCPFTVTGEGPTITIRLTSTASNGSQVTRSYTHEVSVN